VLSLLHPFNCYSMKLSRKILFSVSQRTGRDVIAIDEHVPLLSKSHFSTAQFK